MSTARFVSLPRIAVVGAGALGCAVLRLLARQLPNAHISLIDGDTVEERNIERQPLYDLRDIGQPKVAVARRKLGARVHPLYTFVDSANAVHLLRNHVVVLDCTDDLHAKSVLDTICGRLQLPIISGGVHADQGQMLVLHAPGEDSGLSRSDVFQGRIGGDQDGCDMLAVPMNVISEVGQRMAAAVIALMDGDRLCNGALEVFDIERGWMTYSFTQSA